VPAANRSAWAELARATARLNDIALHCQTAWPDAALAARLEDALGAVRADLRRVRQALVGVLPEEGA
jgi:hypothetical protein